MDFEQFLIADLMMEGSLDSSLPTAEKDATGLRLDCCAQTLRPDNVNSAAEAEHPPDDFAAVGDSEGHEHPAALEQRDFLSGMPDPILGPGRCGFIETQFHFDGSSAHDGQRILNKRF